MNEKKENENIDFMLWNKFKNFFENKGFIEYQPSYGVINNKYPKIYNPKAGFSEISDIISREAVPEKIAWINTSPVFKYENLSSSMITKRELAFYDTITFAFVEPVKKIKISFEKKNISTEINFLYKNKVKTKIQREQVYQEFLTFSKGEGYPVGHDYILSDAFFKKYLKPAHDKYHKEKDAFEKEKSLYKYMAILSLIRMTQKFDQRFELYKNLFDFLESIGIPKEKLRFTIYGGGHPVSDYYIPEEIILKKVLINSFEIDRESIFKLSNENTIETNLDNKYPQIGARSQIFYKVEGRRSDEEIIELGVATFYEYFLDFNDDTIKFSENLISRFSFGLQRLNMVLRIESGRNVEISDISLFHKVTEIIKDFLKMERGYYSNEPFIFEKREIMKMAQYVISATCLLAERVDMDKDKDSLRYKQFEKVLKTLSEMFFEFHFHKKKKNYDLTYDIVDLVVKHYGEIYPKIYRITDAHKERIVKSIISSIEMNFNKNIYKYKSIINQDWK